MLSKSKITTSIERAVTNDVIAPYLVKNDKLNNDFLISRLSSFPKLIQSIILKKAYAHKTVYERNSYIRNTTDNLFSYLPEKLAHLFYTNDDEIQLLAKACADYCRRIIIHPKNETFLALQKSLSVTKKNRYEIKGKSITENSVNGNSGLSHSVNEIHKVCKRYSLEEQNHIYEYVSRYVTGFGIAPPEPTNTKKISGCLKRLADNRWWLRPFRKMINQANEKAAIQLNLVNRRKQIYASNITTKNRLSQLLKNEQLLSSHFIINDAGQRYSLKEISDLNVSNPEVRRAELINRAKDFEKISKTHGHEGYFVTITCPSKYHRAYSKSGAENPKWDGSMPDDAQRYLNNVWARIRAELKRKSISIYGIRVVEPQHDGTPHWHCMLFTKPENLELFGRIVKRYALAEDGDEKGALENRCDLRAIDPAKNATGYIMKYIVKNIDGKGLGEDKFGNDSVTVAKRINAWAACWCIRQFQQIGGASVSVWRELRRLKERFVPDSIIEKARIAADTSDWQGYIEAMGGIESSPRKHPIKLHYEVDINIETGECSQSYYDGELVSKIKGLMFEGIAIITRKLQWRMERLA